MIPWRNTCIKRFCWLPPPCCCCPWSSIWCGKDDGEQTSPVESASESAAVTPQYTAKQVQSQPEATAAQPEPAAASGEAMTKETEDAMAASRWWLAMPPSTSWRNSTARSMLYWETVYSYWVDENVEETDPQAVPDYTIEQARGELRFEINSPWLYLYRSYPPYTYQDIRIDMEVENKAANTNNISLFCRNTGNGWYEFIATSGGYYSIMRYL